MICVLHQVVSGGCYICISPRRTVKKMCRAFKFFCDVSVRSVSASEGVITHLDSVTQIWSQIILLNLDAWLHQSDWKISLCMCVYVCVCVCVCIGFNSVLSFACKLMLLITVNKKYSWSYFSRRGFLTFSCSVNCMIPLTYLWRKGSLPLLSSNLIV